MLDKENKSLLNKLFIIPCKCSDIFEFIMPNENDKISKMNGLDLQNLLILIDDYKIKLRDELNIEKDITFGLELEFENAKKSKIKKQLDENSLSNEWVVKQELTLKNGAEINSPILIDNKKNWEDLNLICSILNNLSSISKKSGGHIHIGTQTLGSSVDSWANFLKLWAVYENIIFRFSYGDFLTFRPNIMKFAKPISENFWIDSYDLKSKKESLDSYILKNNCEKYQAVNFCNVKKDMYDYFHIENTIEFRCPNGTLNPIIWQNNVNFFIKLLTYCKGLYFDNEIIDKRHEINLDIYNNLELYNEIYLNQALELCDLIFTNNTDKVYFLKQYLKSFKISEKHKRYLKNSKITKSKNKITK